MIAALGAIAAVVVAVVIILASGLTGSTKAAGRPSKAQGSTTVQRRDLVETDTESGTLSYAHPQTVFNRLSGTVTWLPPIGRVVKPGQVLYRVDGAPVVLLGGTLPAYRDLSEADTDGPDIEQLERDLRSMGFDPQNQMTIDQTFDAATAAAVERWQESVGEAQTGSITLGQIVFLPAAQRVTAVDAQLGSTSGSSSAASAGSATDTNGTAASHAEFVTLSTKPANPVTPAKPTKPTTSAPQCKPSKAKPTGSRPPAQKPAGKCKPSQTSSSASSKQQLAALLALLKAETLELQKAKSGSGSGSGGRSASGSSTAAAGRGGGGGGSAAGGGTASAAAAESASSGSSGAGSGGAGSGGAGANAQPILQTTSTQLVVTVDLDATMQSEAVVHEPVTVELPDGTTVGGKITQVSPVAQSSSSSSTNAGSSGSGGSGGGGGGGSSQPSATVPVTITLTGRRHVSGLDQAAVSVNFEQQKATNVLSVPVTALLATAGGGYAVQEAAAPNKLVAVTPGLFAAGYVQISGPGIFPGLQVTDSQG